MPSERKTSGRYEDIEQTSRPPSDDEDEAEFKRPLNVTQNLNDTLNTTAATT